MGETKQRRADAYEIEVAKKTELEDEGKRFWSELMLCPTSGADAAT